MLLTHERHSYMIGIGLAQELAAVECHGLVHRTTADQITHPPHLRP